MLVALDFAPGLHGHFLEFIVNKFIYNVSFDGDTIFQQSGAAHKINVNKEYQNSKIVHQAHYSSFGHDYPADTKKIIFIDHDESNLDIVLLNNVYHRCHPDAVHVNDFDMHKITQLHRQYLFCDSDLDSRNNWFAKLDERQFSHAFVQPNSNLPIFYFKYSSFFNLIDFYLELKKLTDFLGETLRFDISFYKFWNEFIKKNQGWHLYKLGNNLIESLLIGNDKKIPNDWKLHAYLNFKISKIFNVYDGILHTEKKYPNNTIELMSIISQHMDNSNKW